MEQYQRRVVEEKAELDAKIARLRTFLGTPNDVSADERVRMHVQLGLMEQYSQVLNQRIDHFV